jgi:hypothetical protein
VGGSSEPPETGLHSSVSTHRTVPGCCDPRQHPLFVFSCVSSSPHQEWRLQNWRLARHRNCAPCATGLGGVAYHLAQFNTASLFPRHRGLISGAFVAGFVGSGLSFFVLRAIINALGGSYAAYRCGGNNTSGVLRFLRPLRSLRPCCRLGEARGLYTELEL